MKLLTLILKNVGRSPLRSILTALGTMVLVFVVTMVWSILWLLDLVTTEKKENLKGIVSERWSIPSRMPFSYAATLGEGAAQKPGDLRPADSMTWQFYGGTIDPQKLTRESIVFGIACEPDKLATMMEGLDNLPQKENALLRDGIAKLKANRQGIILGLNRLESTNKKIGERFKLFGIGGFKDLDLEFEIAGVFPAGRYDNLAALNRDYYNNALDMYPLSHNGRKHLMADRNLNLVWLKLRDTEAFSRVSAQIAQSPYLTAPAVKFETASSGMAAMLEAFRDLIWGMRYLLAPACLVTLSLVIANAISISVRERRMELAVLKVLGFRPMQVLFLVLGESVLLGTVAGLLSAGLSYGVINWYYQGFKFPVAFFDRFLIPTAALWWGPAIGGIAALVGSFLPAWAARNVKPAEVFSKVA
jgi:putative ABC transport system permease protein